MGGQQQVEATLPAIHIVHLLDVAKRWNVEPDELLAGTDLQVDKLTIPGLRLPVSTVERIVVRARALAGEPAIGFFVGMHMKVSWHGFLGFAAMSASTVRDSLALAERFAPTRTSAITLRLDGDGDDAALTIEERTPLTVAREPIVLALVVGIWQIGNALTGRALEGTAELAFPEPPYFAPFAQLAPQHVRFDRPAHRLVFSTALLDLPIQLADPEALALARRQCEAELAALDRQTDFTSRVSAALAEAPATTAAVAKQLGVSTRTLKRRLADAGTTFSALVTAHRRDRATDMLRGEASVHDIAATLGYADAQSFSRAFRRWTGLTPSAFRRTHRGKPQSG